MENLIPLNGRIAIVDNDLKQAEPLMWVLSRHNIPYVFYKGNDVRYLPQNPENDIRILFLDLNLLGEKLERAKDIRSVLYSTLTHIISPQNYPYVLVLWSRQEDEYSDVLSDLFSKELKDRSPITIKKYVKSNFFPNFSQDLDESVDDEKIIEELKQILASLPAYSYIMQWENSIHNSADSTIQDIFHDFHSQENWHNNANCVLDMFASSYLEKHYQDSTPEIKAKASLMFLSDVYYDTLEATIDNIEFPNAGDLPYVVSNDNQNEIISRINKCLLFSDFSDSCHQPGCVLCLDDSAEYIQHFHEIFNDSFFKNGLTNSDAKSLKKEIYKTLIPCEVIVTPACDYAQNKMKNDRIVQGVIIDADYRSYIDSKSEAIHISLVFKYESKNRILVLNFRYFVTTSISVETKPLFRLRSSILAEIQSKLARHISRQGIMNL